VVIMAFRGAWPDVSSPYLCAFYPLPGEVGNMFLRADGLTENNEDGKLRIPEVQPAPISGRMPLVRERGKPHRQSRSLQLDDLCGSRASVVSCSTDFGSATGPDSGTTEPRRPQRTGCDRKIADRKMMFVAPGPPSSCQPFSGPPGRACGLAPMWCVPRSQIKASNARTRTRSASSQTSPNRHWISHDAAPSVWPPGISS
jgi:hypothetical protein